MAMRKSSLSSANAYAFSADMLFRHRARTSTTTLILFFIVCALTFLGITTTWSTVPFNRKPELVISNSVRNFVQGRKLVLRDESKPDKIILFWTPFFGGSNSYMGEEGDRLRHKKCPVSNCVLSENRNLWKESSALIFHAADTSIADLPPQRSPDQYYVFFILESPIHSHSLSIPNFYNLTFTYRFDSDIIADNYLQYYQPKLLTEEKELDDIWETKTKGAVAMVSNCVDFRMEYIAVLAKHFPVDIYGDCGNLTCPKKEKERCDELMRSYKFYLSFENSICRDYLTEKAIRGYMSDTIPVFMGGATYSSIFPSGSFLSVNDFPSPKALAQRMHQISDNKFEYLKYFQFRLDPKMVQLPDNLHPDRTSLCKLCEILNTDPPVRKIYPDMTKWWSISSQCTLREQDLQEKLPFSR